MNDDSGESSSEYEGSRGMMSNRNVSAPSQGRQPPPKRLLRYPHSLSNMYRAVDRSRASLSPQRMSKPSLSAGGLAEGSRMDDCYEGEDEGERRQLSASGPRMHPSTTIGGAPSTELSVRRTATETTQSGGIDPITERMIAVMKCGLLLGACISLALLILLALARIRKTQMMERDASGNVWYLPGMGNITRGVGAGPGMAGGGGGHPGLIAVPLAIFTVVLASVLLFIYEQQVLARQRSSQYFWNWMKVGLICILVGLAATHKSLT